MNSPVRLWRQFWLGGDDAFKNLIFADAEGIQAIGTARKLKTMQHRHGEFDSRLEPKPTFRNNLCRIWRLGFANDGQPSSRPATIRGARLQFRPESVKKQNFVI